MLPVKEEVARVEGQEEGGADSAFGHLSKEIGQCEERHQLRMAESVSA